MGTLMAVIGTYAKMPGGSVMGIQCTENVL